MITPVNNHIIIEPLKHDSFISSTKGTYEEIGIVKSVFPGGEELPFKVNDRVFFDSWLAAKYPTGKDDEYYWLVKVEDIRAYEKVPTK